MKGRKAKYRSPQRCRAQNRSAQDDIESRSRFRVEGAVIRQYDSAAIKLKLRGNSQRMKNANIFVDVDLTLVNAQGQLLEGAKEALQRLRDEGCHLFLWSTAGADYCRKVASRYGMTDFFEGFTAKPDIVIDDMPSTCVTKLVYDVRQEESWVALAERIIDEHID